MPTETMVLYGLLSICIFLGIFNLLKKPKTNKEELEQLKKEVFDELRESRKETVETVSASIKNFSDTQATMSGQISKLQNERLSELSTSMVTSQKTLNNTVVEMLKQSENRLNEFSRKNDESLKNIREDNNKKLEEMRATVDEKLQKTLNERITQSFKLVNEQLEQVYKGLGEMQNLASGVGDLKKVLSNVKTRGILGEIQLGAILEQILSPSQYETNVVTVQGSTERVEFAVKLPAEDNKYVYLPIDAKFPADAYSQLVDAYEQGDITTIEATGKTLESRIKAFAKDINSKYIGPPDTTDFAIMFLPFEGLYSEVVRRGLVETLQNDYKVNIAGPTTMAALLNSLQMGFKTLAIQKRSSEVWEVLGAVKTEFATFEKALSKTQERLNSASDELEKLVGTRTRVIQRKLRSVTELDEVDANRVLNEAVRNNLGETETEEDG
jgi:Uncharacterized protein conserved in bacteria